MTQTKYCSGCDQDLPVDRFRKRTDVNGLRPKCRKCENKLTPAMKLYRKRRTYTLKRKAIEYLGGRCMNPNCPLPSGYVVPDSAFDFHHRDPTTKSFNISNKKKWESIREELDKCDLLCCLCHRILEDEMDRSVLVEKRPESS